MRRLAMAAAVLGVALASMYLWPTDARAIRQRLAMAAAAVSRPAGEGDLQRVARAASLLNSLAPDVVVEAGPDGPSVRGRETVAGLASRLGPGGPSSIELVDTGLVIDGQAGRATATILVRVTGGDRGEVDAYDGTELQVELAKIDGAWLIAHVSRTPALRH
jgi:SnoaL-like domain